MVACVIMHTLWIFYFILFYKKWVNILFCICKIWQLLCFYLAASVATLCISVLWSITSIGTSQFITAGNEKYTDLSLGGKLALCVFIPNVRHNIIAILSIKMSFIFSTGWTSFGCESNGNFWVYKGWFWIQKFIQRYWTNWWSQFGINYYNVYR